MVFSSMVFLCGFLPVVLTVYALCPARFRNFFLFIASLFFYAWGEPRYIVIMLFSTVFDYANGIVMEYLDRREKPQYRKWVLVLSVVVNIGILCFFKYTDFVLESVGTLTGHPLPLLKLALPIGISFYTFQTLSYTIDVYRRKVEIQHNIIDFGMYVCLFPQLIAGPIVRYSDVAEQIRNRRGSWEERAYGVQRFIVGLAKKVLLANQIGDLWSQISVLPQSDMSMSAAWLGAIAYTFQIYFDFSGYSDMAIGLGHILGFRFPENFNYPYLSRSITEFWRRWHMTLGTWFREYVYIPLGGNRKGTIRQIFNLLVVWFLTGLWHGAGWNFILWGLYFFVLLLVEKLFLLREMGRWPKIFRHIYALFFIVLGWAVFACDDMSVLFSYLQSMFGVNVAAGNGIAAYYWQSYGWLLVLLVIGSTQLPKKAVRSVCTWLRTVTGQRFPTGGERLVYGLRMAGLMVLLLISVALLVSGSYNPFLYFRF